ncbi:DUF692 domain-containing protein [Cobetia sp. UCD-24C]|uniref:DUF692 domain-containing protein n=1 Tax=Cobetia sp. UCD-24C TaxID=1716176 RepID=UPI0006CA1191|nr:DUF692 domain-containing protein [Cobetia sp. UCD-24C]KPM80497.1 hypothetical protein AOG28_07615 [Cobetia sp. UCD-24C]
MRAIKPEALGIGLRAEHLTDLNHPRHVDQIDFLELAPENWMNMGGAKREQLDGLAGTYPLIAHGLSLSIGDTTPLNMKHIKNVKEFIEHYDIDIYSEHLSFSHDAKGYIYDLLPIPRRNENILYLADRIKTVQDILGRPLVLENITYYHQYPHEMPEQEFIASLIETSGCHLLLDINNLYINSQNHHYDPIAFMADIPKDAIDYYHIAGHATQGSELIIDTHGHPVCPHVMTLGKDIITSHGRKPVLLERDNDIPSLPTLCAELELLSKEFLQGVRNESADSIAV